MRRFPLLLLLSLAACEPTPPPSADASAVAPDSAPPPAPPRPFVSRDSVVFAFEAHDGQLHYETLYVVGSDRLLYAAPSELDKDGRAFVKVHLRPGSRHTLTRGGARLGAIEVDSAQMASCVGIGAAVRVVDDAALPDGRVTGTGFAAAPPAADWLSQPTAAEDSTARALALDMLRRDSVPAERLAEVEWSPVIAFEGGSAPRTVVVSGEVYAFPEAEMPAYAFVAFEPTPSGPRLVDWSSGDGRSMEGGRVEFFDATDLDGDGTPELILRNTYYESWDYTIRRRGPSGWEQLFSGGGSGC